MCGHKSCTNKDYLIAFCLTISKDNITFSLDPLFTLMYN